MAGRATSMQSAVLQGLQGTRIEGRIRDLRVFSASGGLKPGKGSVSGGRVAFSGGRTLGVPAFGMFSGGVAGDGFGVAETSSPGEIWIRTPSGPRRNVPISPGAGGSPGAVCDRFSRIGSATATACGHERYRRTERAVPEICRPVARITGLFGTLDQVISKGGFDDIAQPADIEAEGSLFEFGHHLTAPKRAEIAA